MKADIEKISEYVEDTGWVDISLNDGYSAVAEWAKPQARRIGKVVFLRGIVKGFSAINFTEFATLPEIFRNGEDRGCQFLVSKLNEPTLKVVLNVNTASGKMVMTIAEGTVTADSGININCTYCI